MVHEASTHLEERARQLLKEATPGRKKKRRRRKGRSKRGVCAGGTCTGTIQYQPKGKIYMYKKREIVIIQECLATAVLVKDGRSI